MGSHLLKFKYLYIFSLSIIFFLIDSTKLGFFADDIAIIYNLKYQDSFINLIKTFQSFDALRYLQVINNYFFFNLIEFTNIDNIHAIQIFIYFINSLFLIYILKKFKIDDIIIFLSWILLIFFSLNYEIAFWTHNLGMTLIASFSFLIFFTLNLKLFNENNLRINLKYEILIIFFSLYSILTYEQFIFAIYFIIIVRSIKLYSEKKYFYSISLISLNTFIIFTLIFLKLQYMENLNLNINQDITQIFKNVLISIVIPFKFILSPSNFQEVKIQNFQIIVVIYLLIFYYFFKYQKNS